jgi:hypothetical protein
MEIEVNKHVLNRVPCSNGAATGCAALVMTLCMTLAHAAPQPVRDNALLEREFWDCDARATRQMLPMEDAVLCAQLTDAVRQSRFDGDFGCFVTWWRAQRHVEYARRATPVPGGGEVRDTSAAPVRCNQSP